MQTCPHPNACLSCDSFLTDGSFRAIHEQQRADTHRLLVSARENNNLRLVDVLERDEQSLSRILEGLDAVEADRAGGEELDLRDLAALGEGGQLMGVEPSRRPLADAAAKRTLDAEQRVRSALRELDREAIVTFASVAERARVSRVSLPAR